MIARWSLAIGNTQSVTATDCAGIQANDTQNPGQALPLFIAHRRSASKLQYVVRGRMFSGKFLKNPAFIYHTQAYYRALKPISESHHYYCCLSLSPDERIQGRQDAGEDDRHRYQDVALLRDNLPIFFYTGFASRWRDKARQAWAGATKKKIEAGGKRDETSGRQWSGVEEELLVRHLSKRRTDARSVE